MSLAGSTQRDVPLPRHFELSSEVPVPAEELFEWHCRPGALARLTPPWERVSSRWLEGDVASGGRVALELRTGLLTQHWLAHHYPSERNEHGECQQTEQEIEQDARARRARRA